MSEHNISILFYTGEFRGDHTADVCLPVEPVAGETIEALLDRVGIGSNTWARGERIEIRLIAITAKGKEASWQKLRKLCGCVPHV